MAVPLTQLGDTSHNSDIRDGLRGLCLIITEDFSSMVSLNKCHCGLISVLSGEIPRY